MRSLWVGCYDGEGVEHLSFFRVGAACFPEVWMGPGGKNFGGVCGNFFAGIFWKFFCGPEIFGKLLADFCDARYFLENQRIENFSKKLCVGIILH